MHVSLQTFLDLFRQHMVSAFFLLLTLTTILSLLSIRWWLRRRLKGFLEEKFDEENELDILPSPSSQDQEALQLIREYRQEVWGLPEAELQLSVDALNQRASRIVRSIAAAYHPQAEIPEYNASLVDLLQLIRRVSTKLTRLAGATPFRIFGNRRLSDYQRFYEVYRKIHENPVLQLLKRNPHLYRVARWAMNLKNLGNPLYWAGKELSREGYFFMLRWFYLTFVSYVGREAMRLYSGRRFQIEEDRDAALVFYRLFALAQQWGGPSSGEWSILVDFMTNHSALESETKLHILSRWSQNRLPKDLGEQRLQTKSGVKWYHQGLKRLMEGDAHPSPLKTQLIQQEMAVQE